ALERAADYSSPVPHVLQSHPFSWAPPEADTIVSDGKCNFAARCDMHFNRNLVSLRVSNGVANRFLRNPVNVQGYGWVKIQLLRAGPTESHILRHPRQFFFESDGRAEHHGSRVADDLVAI